MWGVVYQAHGKAESLGKVVVVLLLFLVYPALELLLVFLWEGVHVACYPVCIHAVFNKAKDGSVTGNYGVALLGPASLLQDFQSRSLAGKITVAEYDNGLFRQTGCFHRR